MAFDKWKELREFVAHQPGGGLILHRMNELDAEEARLKPPAPTLKPGDKVRHRKNKHIGTGVVKEIAKSGTRAYVDFGAVKDWNQKRLHWSPTPSYYLNDLLELVEEAPQ